MYSTNPKIVILLSVTALVLSAAETYQKPPKPILDVMNAPVTPTLQLSPTRDFALQSQTIPYPPIAELAEPMLRIAGMRINPKTNGLHNVVFLTGLTLRKIPSGAEVPLQLPPGARILGPRWSSDGAHFAFTNTTAMGMELWIGDTAGKTRRIEGVAVNGVMPGGVLWMPGDKTLLVETVRANRGAAPREPVPTGPHVQESLGGGAPAPTLEDMLASPHDEDLFVYYATSQLALVDVDTGKVTPVGKPGIVEYIDISPNGKNLLVSTIHKPFSYIHAARSFPHEIEVWDLAGKMLHKVASVPLEDKVPINGVPTGPRNVEWRTSDPATVSYTHLDVYKRQVSGHSFSGGGRSYSAPANRGFSGGGRSYAAPRGFATPRGYAPYAGRAYGGGGYNSGRFYAGRGYYYGGRFWARPYFGVGIGIPFGYGYSGPYGCGYYDGYGNWIPAPCYAYPGY